MRCRSKWRKFRGQLYERGLFVFALPLGLILIIGESIVKLDIDEVVETTLGLVWNRIHWLLFFDEYWRKRLKSRSYRKKKPR